MMLAWGELTNLLALAPVNFIAVASLRFVGVIARKFHEQAVGHFLGGLLLGIIISCDNPVGVNRGAKCGGAFDAATI